MPAAPIFHEGHIRLKEFPLPHAFSLYDAGNMAERFEPSNVRSVRQRKRRILNAIGGYSPDKCVGMKAEHGSRVLKVESGHLGGFLRCDCMVTFIPESVLALAPADCLPILLTNCSRSFAALIHAGWKGLDQGIVGECVKFLKRKRVDPFEIIVAIGPGIKNCCYKNHRVHEELREKDKWKPFLSDDDGISILAKAESDLASAGVLKDNVHAVDLCTCCFEKDGSGSGPLFHSYWRENHGGRFLAVVALC